MKQDKQPDNPYNQQSSQPYDQHNQFGLLRSRRFLPYFMTQALGAFNDNLYKNALLLLIAFGGVTAAADSALYTNLAAGLFILPFFLFSPLAGQLADKFEKSRLIRAVKLLEVIIMAIAAIAIISGNMVLLLALLFLMGLQSTLFGPVKFALLPQQLQPQELLGGNAMVEMGTFLAILTGTITAGLLFNLHGGTLWLASGVIFFALAGLASSYFIPAAEAGSPALIINWNPIAEMRNTLRIARNQPGVLISIVAISWFWFLGAAYLTQFPNLVRDHLGGNPQLVTLLLTLFSVGVAGGSLLCEKLSSHQIEPGLIPVAALGMTLAGIDLSFALNTLQISSQPTAMEFIRSPSSWRLMADIALISAFGGLFVVPLQALIQQRSATAVRAQTIAAVNVMNALFMVLSAVLGIVVLALLQRSIADFFLLIGLLNIPVMGFLFWREPEFVRRTRNWLSPVKSR